MEKINVRTFVSEHIEDKAELFYFLYYGVYELVKDDVIKEALKCMELITKEQLEELE